MKRGSIPDPLAGEKLADLYPRLASFVEQTPRLGRLHYFPGRHLTDTALGREQAVRLERLALRGQAATAGVVRGLDVAWRQAGTEVVFSLAPGQALAASGFDVVVDHAVEVPLAELKLYDHAARAFADLPLGRMPAPPAGAFAAVLLLQPGSAEDADLPLTAQTPEDGADFTPCARVPEDEIYLRTTATDAARLVLYPLPWDEPAGARWRNRAAWSVFALEAAGTAPPWLELGVPLALVGFDAGLAPAWLDRHAVARPAGRPRRRVLTAPALDARYWMARFDQFCAELSTLAAPEPAAAIARYLPPVGLLPRAYLALTQRPAGPATPAAWEPVQRFFPAHYTVDVGVAPLEQLDALIADSVRLEPYAVDRADAVRLLLPVGQQWFDPALLQIETIDPRFDAHLAEFRRTRGEWLARRFDLAQRRHALELSVHGQTTPGPRQPADPDPKRLETPETPVDAPPGEPTQFGVTRAGAAAAPTYASDLLAAVHRRAATFLKKFTAEDIAEFTALFNACGLTRAQAAEAFAPGKPPEWLARLEAGGNDKTLDEAERNELRRELLAYVRKQTEVQELEEKKIGAGRLQELIDYFDARAAEADELVDAGFLKVRTDVFRLGSLLGNSALAQKFTASASLANIIERKPPKADAAAVNAFASQLLANFAPSAVAGLATAAAPKATVAAGVTTAPLRAAATLNATGARATSFVAKDYVEAIDRTGLQIENSKTALTAVNDKLLGANSPLTADEKAAYTLLRDAAQNLTSVDTRNQLLEVAEVAKFADNYVANFDLLSQKQLRAIPLDRLQPALAPTVRQEIHDGRLEIFERLTRLNLSLADLTTDFVDAPGTPVRPAAPTVITRLRFQTLISRRRLDTLATLTPAAAAAQEINDADESRHFASGVSYADMAMAALRAVEQRIREYRAFVEECRRAQQQSLEFIRQIGAALAPVEVALDEARQDVAVALALKAEEQARLDAVNARRAKVLQDHVEFLVYHRPRAVTPVAAAPIRRLEPALAAEPVLDCLRENRTPPADLAALRDAFRAAPARWFRHAGRWLDLVDRWEPLRTLLERAAAVPAAFAAAPPAISAGRFSTAIGRVVQARQVVAQQQTTFVAVDAAALVSLSWLDLRQRAERELTLGQLIAAGSAPLARAAAEELDRLFVVAACLHEQFSRVPGLVRLEWAERFGQFDRVAPDFRDLSRLPGWPGLDFTLRREMQRHADWLFGRVDAAQPAALDLVNDLIRVALLLASHAPVDQLIVGHPLDPEVTPRPGGLLRLKVDPARIRHGMEVFHRVSDTESLRAVVEDIGPAYVAARIVDVSAAGQATLRLTPASTLYFREAR